MSGKIEPKKISAEMADNLFIGRGQLNRTLSGCQADLKSKWASQETAYLSRHGRAKAEGVSVFKKQ
jgi:hypothetical protein